MGKKSARKQALDEIEAQDNMSLEAPVLQCLPPVLTDLEVVSGALFWQGDRWWTTLHPTLPAVVKASTRPDNAGAWGAIAWDGDGTPGVASNLRDVARQSLDQLPFIPVYNQVVVVAARRGIEYTPRMDEQMVASHARPAPR